MKTIQRVRRFWLPIFLMLLLAFPAHGAECPHEWVQKRTEPTCEGKGAIWSECILCGDTKDYENIDALGHRLGGMCWRGQPVPGRVRRPVIVPSADNSRQLLYPAQAISMGRRSKIPPAPPVDIPAITAAPAAAIILRTIPTRWVIGMTKVFSSGSPLTQPWGGCVLPVHAVRKPIR